MLSSDFFYLTPAKISAVSGFRRTVAGTEELFTFYDASEPTPGSMLVSYLCAGIAFVGYRC